MADPIPLSPYLWEFLGQTILLGIGALITIKLVPHFTNKYHEKQKRLDIERETRQIEIDRQREDRQQQLSIQQNLLDKMTKTISDHVMICYCFNQQILGQIWKPTPDDFFKIQSEQMTTGSLLKFYYGEKNKIIEKWAKIADILLYMIAYFDADEKTKDILVETMLKETNAKFNFKEAKDIIQKQGYQNFIQKLDLGTKDLWELVSCTTPEIHKVITFPKDKNPN